MPILFYVWVNSGQYVVNIDFQPLGQKRDGKKGGGGFWGLIFKN
jgi:hypothetical protein